MYRLLQSCPFLKCEQRLDVAFDVNDANAIFFSEIIATGRDIAFYPEDAQLLIQLRAFETFRGKPELPGLML